MYLSIMVRTYIYTRAGDPKQSPAAGVLWCRDTTALATKGQGLRQSSLATKAKKLERIDRTHNIRLVAIGKYMYATDVYYFWVWFITSSVM